MSKIYVTTLQGLNAPDAVLIWHILVTKAGW